MTGRTISHYTIREELGRGGMGVVYRADDERLGRSVALKLLPAQAAGDVEAKERFFQEARAASGFEHPNICSIFDIGETPEGELYLVMPVYEGGTLRDRMNAGVMEPAEAVDFVRQIASGLARAHAKGMVHRDIKPDNLMVLEDGRLVILDFGVAKLAEGLDLTSIGSTIGTAAYMSPEQAQGQEVDGRSDLWAVGVILYEALTGRRPFPGSYDQAVIYGILNADPEPLGDSVRTEFETIVSSLLAKDREERTPDAESLIRALDFATGDGGSAVPAASVAAPVRRGRTPVVFGGVVVVVLAVFLAVWLSGQDSPVTPDPAMAVLPFTVQGSDDIAYLKDGVPTLLTAAIDGVGDLRAIDPISIASVLGDDQVDDASIRRVVDRFQPEGVIVGYITQLDEQIRLRASVYDADAVAGEAIVVTADTPNDLPEAVDELARALMAERFNTQGLTVAGLGAMTSRNFEALRHYMEGETLTRQGEWQQAYERFGQAVDLDSTFAMAWFRMSSLSGWNVRGADPVAETRAAVRHSSRLPARVQALIQIRSDQLEGRVWTARNHLEDYTRRYPDDAYAWYLTGDILFHNNRNIGRSDREAISPLMTAFHLDPTNREVTHHLIDYAVHDGDWEMVDSLLAVAATSTYRTELIGPLRDDAGDVKSIVTQFSQMSLQAEDRATFWFEAHEITELAGSELYRQVVDSVFAYENWPPRLFLGTARYLREGRAQVAIESLVNSALAAGDAPDANVWMVLSPPPAYLQDLSVFPGIPPELEPLLIESVLGGVAAGAMPGELGLSMGAYFVFKEQWAALDPVLDALQATGKPLHQRMAADLSLFRLMKQGMGEEAFTTVRDELRLYRNPLPPEELLPETLWNADPTAFRRWMRAEVLFENQELETAEFWYRSLIQLTDRPSDAAMTYSTPAYKRLAEIAELQGDAAQAIENYTRFIGFWENGDAYFQPYVEEARGRLDALLESNATEAQ